MSEQTIIVPNDPDGDAPDKNVFTREDALNAVKYRCYELTYSGEFLPGAKVRAKLIEEEPELLIAAGFFNEEKGEFGLTHQTVSKYANAVYDELMKAPRRFMAQTLYVLQLRQHLMVQAKVTRAILGEDPKLNQVQNYVSVSRLVGDMLQGHWAPQRVVIDENADDVTVTAADLETARAALEEIDDYERKLIEGGDIAPPT